MMGRKRRTRLDLPQRVYFHHGYYRYVDRSGKWHKLGRQWNQRAIEKYGALVGGGQNVWIMSGLIDAYLENIARKDKAPRTYLNNLKEAKPLRRVFGLMDPQDVLPKDIYAYRRERGKAVASNREIALLSSIFQYALDLGVCNANPCRQVRRLKETPRDRAVSWDDYNAVHARAAPMMQCAMDLAYMTGLRQGRILRIHLNDIQADGLHASTGKLKPRKHIYPLTDELLATVEKAKGIPTKLERMYLIVTRDGTPYTSDGFRANWIRLMRKSLKDGALTEPFTFHDIRSLAADEAANPQELLGHDDPRTTNRVYRRRPRKIEPLRKKP